MKRSDLVDLASQAGFGKLLSGDGLPTMWCGYSLETIERFAQLVQEAEREACAQVCDEHRMIATNYDGAEWAGSCATAIRARSDK